MSITAKYLPASSLAMQRASIEPAAALMSSGNSRNTKRVFPLSIYSHFIFGNTFSVKAAQCGHVIEANSVIVTAALAGPSAMSGSDTGLATSAAPCAIASAIRPSFEKPASRPSPAKDRAAVKTRRVIIKVYSWIGAYTPDEPLNFEHDLIGKRYPLFRIMLWKEAFASLKR